MWRGGGEPEWSALRSDLRTSLEAGGRARGGGGGGRAPGRRTDQTAEGLQAGVPPLSGSEISEVRLPRAGGAEERRLLMCSRGRGGRVVSGGKKVFSSLNRNRDGVGLFHWWG